MNTSSCQHSLVPLLLVAVVVLLESVPATAQAYQGSGFSQSLDQLPPQECDVVRLVIGQLDSDPRPDVAMLVDDGRIAINVQATDLGRYFYIPGSFVAIDVVSEEGVDELMATDGSLLYRVGWNGSDFEAEVVANGLPFGGRFLRNVARSGSSPKLAVIDTGGTTVKLLTRSNGVWSQTQMIDATAAQGQVHIVECMDFDGDGDDEIVLLSDAGVDILGAANTPATLVLDPTGALLEILHGDTTGAGRDLAVLYFVHEEDAYIHVWNEVHFELLELGVTRVGSMSLVDVLLNDGRPDLVLGMDSEPRLYYLQHREVVLPEDPVLGFPDGGPSHVDLSVVGPAGGCSQPLSAPSLAGGDVDLDGDADLIFVNSCNYLSVLPGETVSTGRVLVDESVVMEAYDDVAGQRTFRYSVPVTAPPGVTVLHCSVYHQPSASGYVSPDPIGSTLISVSDSAFTLSLLHAAPPASTGEVFQVLIRPQNSATGAWYESTVRYWSPDSQTNAGLSSGTGDVYPWRIEFRDFPGGTVRRPRVHPIGP